MDTEYVVVVRNAVVFSGTADDAFTVADALIERGIRAIACTVAENDGRRT